jgi:glucose/arabinose dehydrogenase
MRHLLTTGGLVAALLVAPATAQFQIGGSPRVNPDDFALTVFADELNYPVGMAQLDDGSILVAVANGASFFSSTSGQVLRLVDADDDGIAETRQVIMASLNVGGPTALQRVDDLLFVTGQGKPILILRIGAGPDYALRQVGRISITGSGSWLHPNSALVARRAPGTTDTYELYFPLGSKVNFSPTTDTRALSTDFGLSGQLAGDAIHRITFSDDGTRLTGVEHVQIATGLRSASGLAFDPVTGDLYFEDNGIDGLSEAIEAHSADEINRIPADQLGGEIEDFGFPFNHITYRTGEFAGGEGIPPLVAFTPLPDPATGSESEGPNEIAFAPPGFPAGLNDGLFVGFHGQFSKGGLSNEENPLVYVDLDTGEYFHFVSNEESGVGHLDGLLASGDRLFVADISAHGGFGSSASNSGVIYQIRYIGEPVTAVTEMVGETPAGFDLSAAYPNPFNPSTQIDFSVPDVGQGMQATLQVYSVDGQLVATLLDGSVTGGRYHATWNGTDRAGHAVASGSYYLRLRIGDRFTASRQVTLLK